MTELILNQNLRIRPVFDSDSVVAYSIVASVKGRGRLENIVEVVGTHASVVDVCNGLVAASADIEVDEVAYAMLSDLGILINEDEVSRRVMFSCLLDDVECVKPERLTVNPDVVVADFADFGRLDRGFERAMEACERIVVVTDPVTGARLPYWLDDDERVILEQMISGARPPACFDARTVGRFAAACILVNQDTISAARRRLRVAAMQFAKYGYAELSTVLPPLQIAALRRFYRDLIDEGFVAHRDSQVELRFAQHNEPIMRYYHRELRALFARVTGQAILPSYGYFSSYRRGAVLRKHLDRAQCKFTASLLIEYMATPVGDKVWPLYLELPMTGERIAVVLDPGSCVLYRGCELPHYRNEFRGERSTSFFLHYVDSSFSGRLE